MKRFKRGVALAAVTAMCTAMLPSAPIAMGADTDAAVTAFRQMRCHTGKTHAATETGETYYGSGYLVDLLTGTYMSVYNADPEQAEYSTRASAEMKTSAREYALMRIELNSEQTERVDVEFSVQNTNKTFEAYILNSEYADWTADIPMTDYNHTPNTAAAVDTTYAVSKATGHDWSGNEGVFETVDPADSDNSESDKLISFSFDVTEAENEAGYIDVVVVNATSADDTTHIMAGTPTVTTTLQTEPTATPTAEPTATPTAEPTATPTAEPTETPTATPTAEPTETPTAEPTATPTAEPTQRPLVFNKLNMSDKAIYSYSIASKDKHTHADGGEVNIVEASRADQSNRTLIDGDETTVYTSGQTSNCASVIDFGTNIPVSRIVLKDVAASAIIGLAGNEGESSNGVVTENSIKLIQNWARVNESKTNNLTPAIAIEYGEKNSDGRYTSVTLTGDFGNSRYLVFDGNGSSTRCGEIEVYYDGEPLPEPTSTPTPAPGQPTDQPTSQPTSQPSGYPENAIVIKDQPKAGTASTQSITADANGSKRDVAYSNGTGVWYIGTYEYENIDSIDLRLGLVGSDDGTVMPQVRIGYLPADGSVIDDNYVSNNSSAIRSSANQLAVIEGLTEPSAGASVGHQWLGALYTVTGTGISVDSADYAVFPGGNAKLGLGSVPLKTDEKLGKVALFVYTAATKCRATIDYAVVNEKVLTPTELRIDGEDNWIIRGGTASDYETSADAYKAVLISDIGTEMTLNSDYISWSVSGSDYISMKSPSGASSIMTAKQELPIGEHTITLKAEYEDEAGIKLEATKTITVEKRETSVPTQVNISGERALSLLTSQLPYEVDYTAQVLDQFGMEMEDAVIDWSVSGDMTDGISIDNGKLTIGEDAASSVFTVTAKSAVNANASASIDVELVISQYPSKLYPTADVLFRMNNTDTKNVNGPDIEIRNLENSDRGFSGGLKFDISTLREAIEEDYPINSISIRFTTSVSNDGNLVLKEFSNDWDETNSTLNSFANKAEIINEAINSDTVIVSNDEEGAFTLNRMTKGKRIYDGERGDNESLSDWQTTLDIKDYITKWISENPDKNEISFLLMANYNGTTANTVFSKDIDTTYANYSTLITKFPELEGNLGELYPAIVVDYGEETVVISSEVDTLPIPAHDGANTTQLKAVHYDPFEDTSDENIIWSISKFTDENGNVSASADGISISGDGTLSVTKDAKAGVVTVRAASSENRIVYAEKDITIAALTSQLMNGSFENTDDAMYPKNWTSYDPAIDDAHNGVVRYQMDQASETMLSNIQKSNDTGNYLSGTHSAEDPTGLYGKKTVKLTGAHGIDKDYEGKIYTSNAANNSTDGGPDLRVTTGVTYWISQDYHLEEFYQLNPSSLVGPYVGYEGFQGTTGRSNQFSDNWYIKDGSASTAYTTNGYDTLRKQITIPQNIDRLRINWGLTGSEGSIYYHNFRMAPQGIDTSKTAVDGNNVLKVTGAMSWTSDRIAVIPGRNYTYKLSSMSEASASGAVTISFCDAQGNELSNENIESAYTNTWAEKSGNITAPENAAYAYVKLANGTGSGSIWYDNVIFTETTASVATYVTITGGNDMAVVPASGATANRYQYTARITDQYNNDYSGNVVWSLDKDYEGIEIMSNGALIVSDNAEAGTITIRAQAQENGEAYAEKIVTIVKQSEQGGSVELVNGDFSDYDTETLLPNNWTNSGREVSTANGSFDSGISGWKTNSTTYTVSDTSPVFTWDNEVDHTGNSGGSARIFNADRAQGSMQISQNVAISGGNLYNVSVWVKTDHVSQDSNVFASLIFYDSNGSTIEENKNLLVFYPQGDSYGNNTSDWVKLSGSIYANALAARLRIDLRYRGGANNQNGTVWFDDLEITKQAGMDINTTYNGSPSLLIAGYGEEDMDVSRTYGEKWDSDTITGITSGQTYSYSTQVQTFNANKGAYVMITYYDEQGRTLSQDKSEYVTDTGSEWSTLTGTSTAPLNASYAVMSLCIDGQGKAWFADASFTASTAAPNSIAISGADTVTIPSENQYKVVVYDENGAENDTLDIRMSAQCPDGVSFDEQTGILNVSASAKGNQEIIISAEYNGLSASKTVKTLEDATSLSISGSSRVTIPKSGSSTVTYSLLNQLGQKIDASSAQWSVTNTGSGVSIENGVLTVSRGATVQTITIQAEYNGMSAQKRVTLSNTSANTGSGGSGGGGGGGVPGGSGGTGSSLSGSSTGTGNNAMGNFGTGGTGTDEETVTVTNDSLIPQPDVSYFTQGMENIGGFSDIADVTWAQKAIVAMSAVDIVKGREEGKFFPNDSITRAEFVKMLIGMLEYAGRIDTADAECSFADVPEDAWYYSAVAAAVKNGIVTGVSETEFAPDANITRQDMAVMIDRAAKAANISLSNGAELIFTDESAISDYALDAVKAMSKAGIINGFEDGSFSPMSNATRAQATVMLYRVAGGEN